MGAIGLSFGSPTSGSGFDVTSTVNAIVTNLQAAETPYKTQLANAQAQDAVLSNLGTLLSTLSTSISALTDFQGVMASKNGSSSDTSVVNLTNATSSAIAGTHTILVSQLAQTSSMYSGAVAAGDTLSGSISIQVGTGKAVPVNVNSKAPTLSGLAAAINNADIGVTAAVVQNANGQSLSIVSQTSGALGQLTIDSSKLLDATQKNAVMSFSTGQTGRDAIMTVDGIPATSPSNTVIGVIPGVTFQITNASNTPIQVEVTNDTSSVTTALSTMVSSYNAVMTALNAQEGKDASGNPEPLYGSTTLSSLQNALEGALGFSQTGGIQSPSALGLEVNADGTMTLNTDTLGGVLNSNFQDVVAFFQNAGSFGQKFSISVNNAGSSSTYGILKLAQNQNASTELDLNATIANLDANINTQKTQLTAELNTANQVLQGIPSMLESVSEMYSAITGYNQNR